MTHWIKPQAPLGISTIYQNTSNLIIQLCISIPPTANQEIKSKWIDFGHMKPSPKKVDLIAAKAINFNGNWRLTLWEQRLRTLRPTSWTTGLDGQPKPLEWKGTWSGSRESMTILRGLLWFGLNWIFPTRVMKLRRLRLFWTFGNVKWHGIGGDEVDVHRIVLRSDGAQMARRSLVRLPGVMTGRRAAILKWQRPSLRLWTDDKETTTLACWQWCAFGVGWLVFCAHFAGKPRVPVFPRIRQSSTQEEKLQSYPHQLF